jgi:hypothetical protein
MPSTGTSRDNKITAAVKRHLEASEASTTFSCQSVLVVLVLVLLGS